VNAILFGLRLHWLLLNDAYEGRDGKLLAIVSRVQLIDVGCCRIESSQGASEQRVPVIADLLECCSFCLVDKPYFVAAGKKSTQSLAAQLYVYSR
jgi:hypothetical protein